MEEISARFNSFVSWHWENLCREAISGQQFKGKRYGLASRWWGNISRDEQMEFDVVAESTDGKSLLVGECKWSDQENTEYLLETLEEKAEKLSFAKNKEVIPVLFLKSNQKSGENIFTPDQIFELLE